MGAIIQGKQSWATEAAAKRAGEQAGKFVGVRKLPSGRFTYEIEDPTPHWDKRAENSSPFENGRQRALNELAPKLERLGNK